MKAYFHKSFSLDRSNISKVLFSVSENSSPDRFRIAKETGIGIGKNPSDGKVQPTIQYAVYAGLLNDNSAKSNCDIFLSEIGNIIFENDARLKNSVSQWVMHYFLCRTENESLIWSYFIHKFLQKFPEFDGSLLEEELKYEFFGLSKRNIAENCRILIDTYISENGLNKVGILKRTEKNEFALRKVIYPNVYLAAYILAEIWEAKNSDKPKLGMPILLENGHLATTLMLKDYSLRNCLYELKAINAINQEWNDNSLQIIPKWTDKFDLLRRAYEVQQ